MLMKFEPSLKVNENTVSEGLGSPDSLFTCVSDCIHNPCMQIATSIHIQPYISCQLLHGTLLASESISGVHYT